MGAGGCPKTQSALGWSAVRSLLVCDSTRSVTGGTRPARGPQPVTAPVPGEPGQPAELDQPQPQPQPHCHRQARAGRRLPGPDLAAGTELGPEHSRALCPAPTGSDATTPSTPSPCTSCLPGKTSPPPNYLTERKENSRPSRLGCFQMLNKTGLFQASPAASFIFTLSHVKPLHWVRQAGIFFPGKVVFFLSPGRVGMLEASLFQGV